MKKSIKMGTKSATVSLLSEVAGASLGFFCLSKPGHFNQFEILSPTASLYWCPGLVFSL